MEDYAPILWLLFIVVSMGFSALSKARKRAARRADETEEGQERNAGQGHPTVPRVAVADAGNSISPTRTAARGRKPPTQAQQRIGRPAAGYGGNARKGARTVAGNGGDGQ